MTEERSRCLTSKIYFTIVLLPLAATTCAIFRRFCGVVVFTASERIISTKLLWWSLPTVNGLLVLVAAAWATSTHSDIIELQDRQSKVEQRTAAIDGKLDLILKFVDPDKHR